MPTATVGLRRAFERREPRVVIYNFVIVTLYGMTIMLLFTKEKKSAAQIAGLGAVFLLGGLLNLVLATRLSRSTLYRLYPLTVHAPLLLYYIFVIKSPFYQSVFALTAAYMLTTPRKWLIELMIYLLGGGMAASVISETAVSVVLILLIAKFAAPRVIKIFDSEQRETRYIAVLPAAAYEIAYATTVYSNVLFSRPTVTIPVLTTVLTVFFIGFEVYFFDYTNEKTEIRHSRELLDLQLRAVERLAVHLDSEGNYFCADKTVNAFLSMYRAAAKAENTVFVCGCNLPEGAGTADFLVALTCMLDGAIGSAGEYIRFDAAQKNGQLCIMTMTDGAAVYDPTLMTTLKTVVKRHSGIIYTDKNNYKIQISIKKGV